MRILIVLFLVFNSCSTGIKPVTPANPVFINKDSISGRSLLKVSFNKEDYIKEELAEKLNAAGVNYKKLNSIPEGEWMGLEGLSFIEDEWKCEAIFYSYVA